MGSQALFTGHCGTQGCLSWWESLVMGPQVSEEAGSCGRAPAWGRDREALTRGRVSLTEEVMLAEEDKNAEEKSPLDGRSLLSALLTRKGAWWLWAVTRVHAACWGVTLSARPGTCMLVGMRAHAWQSPSRGRPWRVSCALL